MFSEFSYLTFPLSMVLYSFTFHCSHYTNYSPGSVGFDYVATFSDKAGINNENIQKELTSSLNITQNGAFLGDLQISESTNLTEVANLLKVQGKRRIFCCIS